MNKFLKEQIEKHFGAADSLPLDIKNFIEDNIRASFETSFHAGNYWRR